MLTLICEKSVFIYNSFIFSLRGIMSQYFGSYLDELFSFITWVLISFEIVFFF